MGASQGFESIDASGHPVPVELDEFHWHECADRAHMIECIFDTHIMDHPVINQDKELAGMAEKISNQLAELFQKISSKRP